MLNKLLSIQFLLPFSSAFFTLTIIATVAGAWFDIKTFLFLFFVAPLGAGFLAIKLKSLHPFSNILIGISTSIILIIAFLYFIISH